MTFWQMVFVGLYTILSGVGFFRGLYESKVKKNTFGITYLFRMHGAFVWADMVVFGFFWVLMGSISLLLNDWILFLLTISIFWLIRSIGETIYWLNQQFSGLNRNPVKNFKFLNNIFHNDSVWFVYQIFWQCMTVIFILTSLYLGKQWLMG